MRLVEGLLMSKPFNEASSIIKEMDKNNFQWPLDIISHCRVAHVYEFDVLSILTTQVTATYRK